MKLIIQTHLIHPEGTDFEGDLPAAELLDQPDELITFTGPLHYKLRAALSNTGLYIKGFVTAPFKAVCTRCLTEYSDTLRSDEISLYYEELPDDGKIDIGDELREELLVQMPEHPRCSEECLGLCAQCGANLNIEKCRCKKKEIFEEKNVWQSLDELDVK